MSIDSVSWRARMGIYNTFKYQTQGSSKLKDSLLFLMVLPLFINYIFVRLIYYISYFTLRFLIKLAKVIDVEILFLLYIKLLLYCCGDIGFNPGPKQSSLTFRHWELNDIAAHDFVKISLIQGHITENNLDKICLSETFLNSSLNTKDDRLKVQGYSLIRSGHTGSLQKGGVCVYYKEHIPLIRRENLCTLSNCLVAEIRLENEKCFLTCLYR